jgi:hypothetical protein
MLSEERLRQIFFESDKPNPSAILATEVDYVQFANNVEIAVLQDAISFVKGLNPEVGKAFAAWVTADLEANRSPSGLHLVK